jgi:hypothetical protein
MESSQLQVGSERKGLIASAMIGQRFSHSMHRRPSEPMSEVGWPLWPGPCICRRSARRRIASTSQDRESISTLSATQELVERTLQPKKVELDGARGSRRNRRHTDISRQFERMDLVIEPLLSKVHFRQYVCQQSERINLAEIDRPGG